MNMDNLFTRKLEKISCQVLFHVQKITQVYDLFTFVPIQGFCNFPTVTTSDKKCCSNVIYSKRRKSHSKYQEM